MISKMLIPAAKDRIPIQQLLAFVGHPNSLSTLGEFPEPDDSWKQSAFEKISYEMNIPIDELYNKLQSNPQSSLGGIYNIRRHSHLLRQLNLSPLSRHVSFRAISTPPAIKCNLTTPDSSSVPIKSPSPQVNENHTSRLTRYRYSDRRTTPVSKTSDQLRTLYDNKVLLTRPETPNIQIKPASTPRSRPSSLRKPLERRCKTATTPAEAFGKQRAYLEKTSTRLFTGPQRVVDPQLKNPNILGNVLLNRRSVPATKRYASDRASNMRPAVSEPERPRTTCVTSISNNQHAIRHCFVDCSDTKGRRSIGGVPTHTAARAAIRLAKVSCITDNERSTTVKNIAGTRRSKLRAHVRNTIDTLSRSFSKFVFPSKRDNGWNEEGENTEAFAYTRRKTIESKEADKHKMTDTKRINVSTNIGSKRSNGLAFWRRVKP